MTHLALAGGAQGIVWYWLPSARTGHLPTEMPVVWEGLKTVVQETRELEPWLLTMPSEADRIDLPEPLRGWSREHGGVRVLAIANPTDKPIWLDAYHTNRPAWLTHAKARPGTSERKGSRWHVPARNAVVWSVEVD